MLYAMDKNITTKPRRQPMKKTKQNKTKQKKKKKKKTAIITIYKCILIINICNVKGRQNYFFKKL